MQFHARDKGSAAETQGMRGPLEGLRLIEAGGAAAPLAVRLALSMAGKIAGELGAEVVLVEPPGGDPVRQMPPFLRGAGRRSALFEFLSAGKRIVYVRDGDPRHLVSDAHGVLIDASIPMPEGITAVVVSTFGPHQPNLREPASELTLMAMSGVLHLTREQFGEPVRLPGHQPAYAAGLAAFLAMTAGLLAPTPRTADVSVLDALLWVNWKIACEPSRKAPPGKAAAEWQAVPASDGHVALVYMDRDWPALAELVGDPRLREERFATREARLANLDALMAVLRPWFAVRRKADIYREAKLRSIPLGPVWTISDLLRDAQYIERDFLAATPTGIVPRLPAIWNGRRPRYASSKQPPVGAVLDV